MGRASELLHMSHDYLYLTGSEGVGIDGQGLHPNGSREESTSLSFLFSFPSLLARASQLCTVCTGQEGNPGPSGG